MQKEITNVLRYFAYFSYPPTFEEVWMFLSKKIMREDFEKQLQKEIKRGVVATDKKNKRYTLGEYHNFFKKIDYKVENSKLKVDSVRFFIRLLAFFPQIRLIGISGSVAVSNASENDDIDLFIITAKKRIWTARFIAILLAEITGRRRRRNEKHTQNKICLNMFVDESGLSIPHKKQTFYVAHEVLQMKPQVSKFGTYERFLKTNQWVYTYFPNSKLKIQNSKLQVIPSESLNLIADLVEYILKNIQLTLIRRHTTTEIITETQLWFFPADFEHKLLQDKIL